MSKLLIYNAKVATSTEVFAGAVLVEGQYITGIYHAGQVLPALPKTQCLNAMGQYLLPGGVDAHTHFSLDAGGVCASDDFYTGTVAAACGGTTTVIDHPGFGPAGCTLAHQIEKYHSLAQRAVIDYGFHGVVQQLQPNTLVQMRRLRDEEGVSSLKIYLTYGYKIDDADAMQLLRYAKQLGLRLCVHCENDSVITALRAQFAMQQNTAARYHPLSRPPQAEAEAVFRMLMLAQIAEDAPLYIVHVSTALAVKAIALARRTGQKNAFAETCPQYLLLTDEMYDDPQEGLKYIMSPPLRKKADNAALWMALEDASVQSVGTDHCPFFFATQKQLGAQDFSKCPNGAPGVQLRMALMFSHGYLKGRLTLPQLVQRCCTAPAHIFGIAPLKGDICLGAHADLVLIDPTQKWTATNADLVENVDYTPYQGILLGARLTHTFSRGQLIAKNGVFLGEAGHGKYLRRGPTFMVK